MRSNDEIMNLIIELRKQRKMTSSELASLTGVAKSAMSRYENRTRQFPINKINEFAVALGTTPQYLLGLDSNHNEDQTIALTEIKEVSAKLELTRQHKVLSYAKTLLQEQYNQNVVSLDSYKEDRQQHNIKLQSKVSAGRGVVDLDPNCAETIAYYGKLPRHYDLAFQVDGNSMEPVFENGDIIFVEKMDEIINGALMVVTIENEAFIKKVYLENDCIRLVSLNKDYEDIRASEGIKIIGKVVF